MRLLTRSDFDGLACGALLKYLGMIDCWKFVHPKDIQDGLVEVNTNDILANIPYAEGCSMWFDQHVDEQDQPEESVSHTGVVRPMDSAARVIFEHYNGKEKMPHMAEMIDAVDKVDSACLTVEEILNPTGWILLGFIMDPRTGLGRFRNFRISNYDLMSSLIDLCSKQTIDEILQNPDVEDRLSLYFEQEALFRRMLRDHTVIDGNIIFTDLRGVETIYSGNRFLKYSLYPEQNISIWVVDGRNKKNCAIAVGHSIIQRTSQTDIGSLMLQYGGGGHRKGGTCQVDNADASRVIAEISEKIKQDG